MAASLVQMANNFFQVIIFGLAASMLVGNVNLAATGVSTELEQATNATLLAAMMASMALSVVKSSAQRIFYSFITATITTTAVAYLSIKIQLQNEHDYHKNEAGRYLRQSFNARYINWLLTNPLLLLNVLQSYDIAKSIAVPTFLLNEVMVIGAIAGSLMESFFKWLYLADSVVAFLVIANVIIYDVLIPNGRQYAPVIRIDITNFGTVCSVLVISMWLLCPIIWAFCGGNFVIPEYEAMLYDALDMLAKLVLSALLLQDPPAGNHHHVKIPRCRCEMGCRCG